MAGEAAPERPGDAAAELDAVADQAIESATAICRDNHQMANVRDRGSIFKDWGGLTASQW
jgi:hypothetical protein